MFSEKMHSTTILCVRKNKEVVMMSDGQVTLGDMVSKNTAMKVKKLCGDRFLVGFAGSVVDALTLVERLEEKLEKYSYNLTRSVIELSRDWRTDKYLRRLECAMLVANKELLYSVGGNGDIIEVETGVASVGSGSKFALAAARALYDIDDMTADKIATKAMTIAGDLCIYTNNHHTKISL